MPMLRLCDGMFETGWPSNRMSPASGVRKPAIRLSVVVLPEPLGPSSETKAPAGISSETSSTARNEPKVFVSPRKWTFAPCVEPDGASAVIDRIHGRCQGVQSWC